MATAEEKARIKEWEAYKADILNATPVETDLTEAEKERKRAYLEARPVEWIRYFFPKYATYPFAAFQTRAIRRILEHDEWFEVLSWSRELAKSTVVMFCVMYLALTGRKRNVILASATEASAAKLLRPYLANFEANGRIRAFYGEQKNIGQWGENAFKPKCGCSFMGVGAGNAPRGARNGAVRPDVLLVDDFDTDEDCRNPHTLDKKWDWWEHALYPTRSVSEPTLVVFCGNLIAKDTCVARAGAKADHWDIVNLVDKDGRSAWPEKNTQERIERIRASISTSAFQGEYMNNPVTEGKVFHNLGWGKVPDLRKFEFLVAYGDPACSNGRSKAASTKAVALVGRIRQTYYLIKCFVGRVSNAEYIEWFYHMKEYVGRKAAVYYYQENNALQAPFFEQVFKPLVREANERKRDSLFIIGDSRDKIDKATRIEANLEPLDRNGQLVFNEEERDNVHMREMRDQFSLFELPLPFPADGPDAVEGAVNVIARKTRELDPGLAIGYGELREGDRRNRF